MVEYSVDWKIPCGFRFFSGCDACQTVVAWLINVHYALHRNVGFSEYICRGIGSSSGTGREDHLMGRCCRSPRVRMVFWPALLRDLGILSHAEGMRRDDVDGWIGCFMPISNSGVLKSRSESTSMTRIQDHNMQLSTQARQRPRQKY